MYLFALKDQDWNAALKDKPNNLTLSVLVLSKNAWCWRSIESLNEAPLCSSPVIFIHEDAFATTAVKLPGGPDSISGVFIHSAGGDSPDKSVAENFINNSISNDQQALKTRLRDLSVAFTRSGSRDHQVPLVDEVFEWLCADNCKNGVLGVLSDEIRASLLQLEIAYNGLYARSLVNPLLVQCVRLQCVTAQSVTEAKKREWIEQSVSWFKESGIDRLISDNDLQAPATALNEWLSSNLTLPIDGCVPNPIRDFLEAAKRFIRKVAPSA